MSQQERLAYLQKRFVELNKSYWRAILLGIIGAFIFGVFWNVLLQYDFAVGIILVVAIAIAIEIPLYRFYNREIKNILFEIQQITKNIKE